jgi:hypothetical protein
VKPVELALAGLAIGLGVARVALGFFRGLRAGEADADVPAENVVPTHLHFRLRSGGEACAHVLKPLDQRVERAEVLHFDKIFDSSTHHQNPSRSLPGRLLACSGIGLQP